MVKKVSNLTEEEKEILNQPSESILPIDYEDIAYLNLDEFWDKYSEIYMINKEYNGEELISETISIPVKDFSWGMIHNEPFIEMWDCCCFHNIELKKLYCGYLGDIYILNSFGCFDDWFFKGKNSENVMNSFKHILQQIYFHIRNIHIEFISKVRFYICVSNGYNITENKQPFVDLEKFVERNADRYNILYKYDENNNMIVCYIGEDWV